MALRINRVRSVAKKQQSAGSALQQTPNVLICICVCCSCMTLDSLKGAASSSNLQPPFALRAGGDREAQIAQQEKGNKQ